MRFVRFGVLAAGAGFTLGAVHYEALGVPPIPLSQHASVSQSIAGTEITIEYNRPVARGRVIFGGVVPWDRVWCPGADTATRLTVTRPIQVNGSTLPAGAYGIWAIPDSARWTVIFSHAAHHFHVPYPEGQDALRVTATPRAAPHMETLAFYFPMVDSTRAELVLHWGETQVPLAIVAQ